MSSKTVHLSNPLARTRVAIVISSPAVLTATGWPLAFWWSELIHTYFDFSEKSYEIKSSAQRLGAQGPPNYRRHGSLPVAAIMSSRNRPLRARPCRSKMAARRHDAPETGRVITVWGRG
jgi:hypothetical protein